MYFKLRHSLKFWLCLILLSLSLSCSLNGILPDGVRPEGIRSEKEILKMRWARNLDPVYNTGNLPIALQSVEIYQGLLFAGSDEGVMSAYDLETGRILWSHQDTDGQHAGPVVYNNKLIYGNRQGRVYARDYLTGELIYSVDLDAPIETRGVIVDGRLFFHLRNHKIFSMDATTGKVLWSYRRSVPFLTTVQGSSKPLIWNNQIIVGFADGFLVSLNLEDGLLLWESRLGQGSQFVDVDLSPKFVGDYIVASSLAGELTLIDPTSGNVVRRVDVTPSRAPIVLDSGGMLIGTVDGSLHLYDAQFNPLKHLELSQLPVTGIFSWKDGYLVTMASKEIYWFSKDLSTKKKAFDLGHAHSSILGEPRVEDDYFAFISSRHRLYVFK